MWQGQLRDQIPPPRGGRAGTPGRWGPPGSGAGSCTNEGQKGLWVPGSSRRAADYRRVFLQPLSQRSHCCPQGRSSDVLFWPRQFLSFRTKLQTRSTVGWHFSPCRLWNSHREAIYQHRVCIQSPGLSASPPVIGHLHST